MRKNWRNSLLMVWMLLLFACSGEKHAEHADTYTCPMHPTVVSDRPGTCPVCGMDLVRKARPGEEVAITADLARLLKSPNEVVTTNITTVMGEFKSMDVPVSATGIVTYDTRNLYTIPSRIAGRLEKVYLKYGFQHVSKGQKVAEIYSPDVQTAQRELSYLLDHDPDNTSLIEAARSKLSLLGATPSQAPTIAVFSPYDGYLVGDELIREGNYVTAGQTLFKVVNTSALRVELDMPVSQAGSIKLNDTVQLNFGDGRISEAKVDLVQPFLNANEEFVKVRVNVNARLQIGQLVKATVQLRTSEALWLPKAAVVDLGFEQVVFLKERDSFKPKVVTTGIRSDDSIEIKHGLLSSDEVAANAHYLVDSESFIRTSERSNVDKIVQHGDENSQHENHGSENTIMLSDSQIKLANITTQKVTVKPVGQSVMVNGALRTDENRTEMISSRAGGRIEKLFARQTGVPIRKGEPLYELYSEELLTMQKEYLLAKDQYETGGKEQTRYVSYLKAAERKLLLYGLTQSQIDKLGQSKRADDRITFLAPAGGTIAEIGVAEGQYVDEGMMLYKIDDISKLWVEADVYPNELPAIKTGDRVKVNVAGYETSTVEAVVDFVSPEYKSGSQVTVVRAAISNSDGKFRGGMQAQVLFTHSSRKALSIPVDAVIRDGRGMHVYVQTDVNTFQPRMVKTGVEDFEQVEITDGISENEIVAISGAYLLYSEFKTQNKLPL